MIEMIDRHLHGLLARLEHVRPAKSPNDTILMQFVADCPRCGRSACLSIALAKGGKVVLNCHSRRGCGTPVILASIDLHSQSVLFAPPVGDGQPPYEKRTMSQMIATWLRAALREPTPAANVLKMFRGLASESLVQKVRTEIGVEMTKSGFPAVPHWRLRGMRAFAEAEQSVESQERVNAEESPIANKGAGSRSGGIDQLQLQATNPPIARPGKGFCRGGTSGPEIVHDSTSVGPVSLADSSAFPQRRNGRNPHVTSTRNRGGGEEREHVTRDVHVPLGLKCRDRRAKRAPQTRAMSVATSTTPFSRTRASPKRHSQSGRAQGSMHEVTPRTVRPSRGRPRTTCKVTPQQLPASCSAESAEAWTRTRTANKRHRITCSRWEVQA